MKTLRLLLSALGLLFCLAFSATVHAASTIAVVDFQRALNEVKEGTTARAQLEAMFTEKKNAMTSMENQLATMQAEYEKQAIILSEAAKAQKEQELMQAQMVYQQTYMQAEQEMQQAYGVMMEKLITKMRTISEEIGKEKGFELIVEATEGGVVYAVDALDITDELVKRYNVAHGG